jgi:hypothetical protein
MSPILGILASSRPGVAANSYESIATVTVGSGGSSSISFSSIPSTYQHLQIRALTANSSFPSTSAYLYLNSDTTAGNYYQHYLYGSGSGSAVAGNGGNTALNGLMGNAMTTGGAAWVIDLLDYANTNKNKTIRLLNGYDNNGSGYIWFASNLWSNTSAVNTFTITAGVGSFNQYSSFALYGIKG